MNTQKALETLISAAKVEAQKLIHEGTANGDFTIEVKISCRLDDIEKMKLTLDLAHYHYAKFEPSTHVKGIDWAETFRALNSLLSRDSSLSRLAAPKDESI